MSSPQNQFSYDEQCVLDYLATCPGQFVPEGQITRHADTKTRFLKEPGWTRVVLRNLADKQLVEVDDSGRYRSLSAKKPGTSPARPKKFMAPQFREILEQKGAHVDLNKFST
jgi:hypothetical protein